MRSINAVKKIVLLLSFIFIATLSMAQPPDDGGEGEDPDEGIPIDGGVSLLAAAGVAYGVKKVYNRKKQKEASEENN